MAQAGLANGLASQNAGNKNFGYTSGNNNTAVLGSNEAYFLLSSIAASGTLTLALNSLTDVCNQAAVNFVRLKAWRFHLLAATDSAPDGTSGTACSGVTIGGGSNPFAFGQASATAFTLNNGSRWGVCDGSANGYAVGGSAYNINITNLDATNAAKLLVLLVGGTT